MGQLPGKVGKEVEIEIERKFLLEELPEGLEGLKKDRIEQSYASLKPEIRVRRINNKKCVMTIKSSGGLVREEREEEISGEDYQRLAEPFKGYNLVKDRYYLPLGGNIIEIDDYKDIEGLYTAEVEFDSLERAMEFKVPAFFGKEVTEDRHYKNKNIAKRLNEERRGKGGIVWR